MFAQGAADAPRSLGENGAGELKACGAGGAKNDKHHAPHQYQMNTMRII
jgi:hypothetical protein